MKFALSKDATPWTAPAPLAVASLISTAPSTLTVKTLSGNLGTPTVESVASLADTNPGDADPAVADEGEEMLFVVMVAVVW